MILTLLLLLALPWWPFSKHEVKQNKGQFVSGRVLVKFKAGISPTEAHLHLGGYRCESELPGIAIHVIKVKTGKEEDAIQSIKKQPDVEYAELDRIIQPQALTPQDPAYYIQWALPKISAPAAWSVTTGSSGVIIAVIDTGVDGSHVDLSAKMVPGWNIYDGNSNTNDVQGHGTAVAGVIAASTNNGVGVAGACWACKLMPIRVSDAFGGVSFTNAAAGIMWAADHGVRIANLSFGVVGSSAISSAAQYLQSKGGLLIASAVGNGATYSIPDDPYMLVVGSTDNNDVIYSWSSRGPDIDLVAPGNIYTTQPPNTYASGTGTSYSAPIVAGVAGLVLSLNPALTASQLSDILLQSVDDLGPVGRDPSYGTGRINALKAVNNAGGGGGNSNTTTTLTSSPNPSTTGQAVTFTATVSPTAASGTVTFLDGGTALGTVALSGGAAAFSTSALATGTHSVTASYGGATSYNASASAALTQTVTSTKTNTTTGICQLMSFTATVSPAAATGTITWKNGTAILGTSSLVSGTATSPAFCLAGPRSITATYNGDSSYNGSVSVTLSQ